MKTLCAVAMVFSFALEGWSAPIAPSDSIPCVIITDSSMLSAFQGYALWKTKKGMNTEVITVDEINAQYAGPTVPVRIRAYLRTRFENNHMEYLLIGGDLDVVPGYYVNWYLGPILTDMYYSCLNGDWNQDGDTLVAEPPSYGDTVDYEQQVAVGRIPCNSASEAEAVINKILDYETDTSQPGYRTQALITSSLLKEEGDGDGRIIVNNSHAQWHESFLTYFIPGPPNGSTRRSIIRQDIDTLRNTNRYGIFFNFTCYNNLLDEPGALSRHFILNPLGGGVGYVGSTYHEFSLYMEDFHMQIFRAVFDSSLVQVGSALMAAKKGIAPQWRLEWGYTWLLFYSMLYLGDPQMEIWTAEPQVVAVDCPNSAPLGPQTVTATVSQYGNPIDSALVCLFKEDDVYLIGRTNAEGVTTFNDVIFSTVGEASIVVTKHNYFPVEETVTISSSCCVLRTGDANCQDGDEPTISDVAVLIDFLFISGNPPCCIPEADVNQSGGANPTLEDVTISDCSYLQDYLFITGPSLGLPDCL